MKPKPEEILASFAAAIGTGVFTGPMSNHMQGESLDIGKMGARRGTKNQKLCKGRFEVSAEEHPKAKTLGRRGVCLSQSKVTLE
jgi:hypothetical protein